MKQLKYYLIVIALLIVAVKVCGDQAEKEPENLYTEQRESHDAAKSRGEHADSQEKAKNRQADDISDKLEIPAPIANGNEMILKRKAYTTSYNPSTKLPNWVAWHLTANHVDGNHSRGGMKFHEDEDVPEPRATDNDYKGSGYDRGHMCPSGDNKWDADAQWESFYFTNACPQHHGLNRGDWNEMEQQCRKWARQMGDIYIVCGPILYKGPHKTIGENQVVVPEAFFKVVLCMRGTPKAIGFIYRNTDGNRPKGDYVNTVDQVERITGLDFFPALPDDVETKVEAEANLDEWY